MPAGKNSVVENVIFSKSAWKEIKERAKRRGLSAAAFIRETMSDENDSLRIERKDIEEIKNLLSELQKLNEKKSDHAPAEARDRELSRSDVKALERKYQ